MNRVIRGFLLIPSALWLSGCPLGTDPAGAPSFFDVDRGCLDFWSVAHAESGAALGLVGGRDRLGASIAVLTGWEIVEPVFWSGESGFNQVCDLVVGAAGWVAGASLGR